MRINEGEEVVTEEQDGGSNFVEIEMKLEEGDFTFAGTEVEGGSCHVLSEGRFEDEAAFMPTRTPPRKWTLAEAKWFASR